MGVTAGRRVRRDRSEFGLDRGFEAFADLGHGDLLEQFMEEAAHDEPSGLVLGDTAGTQVEQLLVVEASGRRGVSGATISPVSISRFGTESARAPSVSTRLRLSSKVSVPSASARMSTSPIHTVRASGLPESGSPWSAPLYTTFDLQCGCE